MVFSYPDAPESERNSAFLVANFCVLLVAKNCVFLFASYNIVEIDGVNYLATGHQSENVLFDENSIEVSDVYPNDRLNLISENEQPLIFGNSKKAIHEKYIGQLHYSLMLIAIEEFEVTKKVSDKMQVRLTFVYNGLSYNLPITDPHFIQNYENDPECLSDVNELFLALSLGLEFNEFYHKLVAGLMY